MEGYRNYTSTTPFHNASYAKLCLFDARIDLDHFGGAIFIGFV